MLLTKLAEPVPSVVFELAVVGLVVVLQQTPLAVIATPPSKTIVPPLTAVIAVMEDIATVVNVGIPVGGAVVVNVISLPYVVPLELVAYALTWYIVAPFNPVMLLVKLSEPVPSLVIESTEAVVGLAIVLQQTPLAFMLAPPSEVIAPPLTAVVIVIPVTAEVVTVGLCIDVVVNVTSLPYAVPFALVA